MNIPIGVNQYQTDEFPLALTLVTIGVPFADDNCRMQNIYTESFLRKLGKTAEECVATNIPGDKQQWIFKFTEECQAAIPIFKAIWDSKDNQEFPNIDIPDLVRICALVLKNRGILAQDFKKHTPKVSIPRGPMGEVTILTRNTPEAGKQQMGIEG
jgi:hypothetical protein